MSARVAVNMLWSVPGVGGSEEYLARQMLGLASIGADLEIEVLAPRGFTERRPDVAGAVRVREVRSFNTTRATRIAIEHSWLAFATRGFDLVHHGGGTVPRLGNPTTLVTLHDVQWTAYPEYVGATKLRYLRSMVPSSLRRATRIAVPSRFVASTLTAEFGIDPPRISVVRHGLQGAVGTAPTSGAELRSRLGLGSGPVLVYPANTHPHKNHVLLLDLLARGAGAWADPALRLVFAGSPGRAEDEVRAAISARGLGDRVVMAGRVSDADRDGLLALAEAMVFPSLYEGFGAPVIEAMRIGTPVVCADRGSLPEVAGDAAVVVEPDVDAWAGALDRVRTERAEMVARGRARAAEFTAEKSAEDLVDAYRVVLDDGGAR
ncbi:MAG: glycosyltransferase family 4 protein [Actinomycetota bacterium]